MLRIFSTFRLVTALTFFASMLISNSAWAEKESDYIEALGDEAKITKMKDEKPVPEYGSEPAVMPDKSTDVKKIVSEVSKKLRKVLGLSSDKTDSKKEDDLEKVVSSALEQGNSMDDIRNAVNKAMIDLKVQPGQTTNPDTLESVSKALNQVVGESIDAVEGNPEDNYIRSLNKQLAEQSAPKVQSVKASSSTKSSIKRNNKSNIERLGTERTITVLKNESLSRISQRVYGSNKHYTLLYKANRDTIKNPDIIKIGQILRVPDLPRY